MINLHESQLSLEKVRSLPTKLAASADVAPLCPEGTMSCDWPPAPPPPE